MRSRTLLLCTCIVAGALVAIVHSTAQAAERVLTMDRQGRVHRHVDRALPPLDEAALAPAGTAASTTTAAGPPRAVASASKARERTVRGELKRLLASRQIDAATAARDRRAFDDAIRTARRLSGTRRTELRAVISTLHDIAARGQLTAARLPGLFATLAANRRWWTTGTLLGYGQRVEFSDSELVWEYYPGQGIQLQVLGTFGKANGLWQAGAGEQLRALLDEMIPLASARGGALAWEYDFAFGGGTPPWTSGMAQATGIQALARAGELLGDPVYLQTAGRALKLFSLPAPVGVRVPAPAGARYLLYSFDPGQLVVNAEIQTLVALHDYATLTGSATARALFDAGDRQAQRDVAADNTGAWSLYQLGGEESDLSYHELLTGFLHNLCDRTQTPIYCTTADAYARDLHTPPSLTLVTRHVRAGRPALVRFSLSKVSRVGMTIRRASDGKTVLATSASVSHGTHSYGWSVPKAPGSYEVTLTGSDLAGNSGRTTGTIQAVGRRRAPPRT